MFGTVDIIKKTLTNKVTSLIFGGDEHKDWRDTEVKLVQAVLVMMMIMMQSVPQ